MAAAAVSGGRLGQKGRRDAPQNALQRPFARFDGAKDAMAKGRGMKRAHRPREGRDGGTCEEEGCDGTARRREGEGLRA